METTKLDDLCRRVFLSLREGRLETDPVVELACELLDWGCSGSAVREVVERVPAELSAGEWAGLAARLLDEANFRPGLDLLPERLEVLRRALRVVARDMAAGGIEGEPELVLVDDFGPAVPEIRLADGRRLAGGSDLSLVGDIADVGDGFAHAVAAVADCAQCGLMEQTWQVWPVCPEHDRLGAHAAVRSGEAVWWCVGRSGHLVGTVGELGARRRGSSG